MFLSVMNTSFGGLWATEDYQRSFYDGLEKAVIDIDYHTIHLLCAAGVFTARLFLDLSSTSASLSSLPFFIFIDKPDATLLNDFEMPEEFKLSKRMNINMDSWTANLFFLASCSACYPPWVVLLKFEIILQLRF